MIQRKSKKKKPWYLWVALAIYLIKNMSPFELAKWVESRWAVPIIPHRCWTSLVGIESLAVCQVMRISVSSSQKVQISSSTGPHSPYLIFSSLASWTPPSDKVVHHPQSLGMWAIWNSGKFARFQANKLRRRISHVEKKGANFMSSRRVSENKLIGNVVNAISVTWINVQICI